MMKGASPKPVKSEHGMVVSSSSLATKVGVKILKMGGNAVDATVAVGFALAVTYPQAGNLGGGGFMVIHLKNGKNTTIDFREKAPLKAFRDMYLDSNGNVLHNLSLDGATASGVPGSVAGLLYALKHYGTMKLQEVIQPAIDLAENGFSVDAYLARALGENLMNFDKYGSTRKVFTKNGKSYKEGDILKQPDLAFTLNQIKNNGKDGFYKGKIAELIVKQISSMDGYITAKDLEKYEPVERQPIYGNYRGYEIVSMPPPSSGGVALVELLNILENYTFTKNDWGSSQYIHKLVEAMKYVYADRTEYLGDPDFVKVPIKQLTSEEYAKKIFNKIKIDKATPSKDIIPNKIVLGKESRETTHYSISDNEGDAVSVTTTINSWFGNKVVVDGAGFFLNNEMDDFSAKPGVPNQFGLMGNEANSIQPGKRMLSSMTPTIVLKNNKPFIVIGSPGGSTIITAVLQVIMNCIDFNMNIQEAVDAPRIHHQWYPERIDYERFALSKDVKEELIKMGHKLGEETTLGETQGIMIDQKNHLFFGAADPRGNGLAEGY
jgi:gamma-glutamyltranspeptidase / glutathione hydrolase